MCFVKFPFVLKLLGMKFLLNLGMKSLFNWFLPEFAVRTRIRTKIGMSSDVLLEHRWLLAPDAAFLTNVFASSATPDVSVLIGILKSGDG